MKKEYYINEYITYCYPYEVNRRITDYGILEQYMNKKFTRKEIDEIICEMILKHPYVPHSMFIKMSIMKNNEYYHILNFKNDNYDKQKNVNKSIKYKYI